MSQVGEQGQDEHDAGHDDHPAPVPFLELFYDLVFVAATVVLSNVFSHDIGWMSAARTTLMFVLLWLLWFHSTVQMNVQRLDDTLQRGLVFAQMLLIFLSAVAYADHHINTVDFVAISYSVAVLFVAFGFHRLRHSPDPVGTWALRRRNRLMLAAGVMIVGFFVPDGPDLVLYPLAIIALAWPTSVRTHRALAKAIPAMDEHHLTERAALLTLIVMGESLVKAALVITGGSLGIWDISALVVLFIVLFGLFSLYFDDIPKAGIRPGIVFGELWLLAHVVLQVSIVGLAVGVSGYLQTGDDNAPDWAIIVTMIAFAGIFVGLTMIAAFDRREPRGALIATRLVTAGLAIGLGFIPLVARSIVPGSYLSELAILSVGCAIVSARIRRRTTIVPADSPKFVPQHLRTTAEVAP